MPTPRNPGVNQRAQIRMTDEEVAAYLREQQTVIMSTLCADGTIHSVAMWYGLIDGDIVLETKAKSQKAVNLRRDPRITCLIEDGTRYDQLRGVELVGRGEVIDEPEALWQVGVAVFEKNNHPYTEADRPAIERLVHKRVGVRVHTDKVVSWDHRKLGLSPADLSL
jgi:PPOX class probable F420-dependent enzyme